MTSASATRAQWAGYQAPDENEDPWAEIQLPEEMRDTYGQQPYVEFTSDEERTRLGFACLPVELDETAEDLGEMIGRWGSNDKAKDGGRSERPGVTAAQDFQLDSKTLALVAGLNRPAWPAWLSHLALPGGPPPPKTPTRAGTEGNTPVASQDVLAEFLHDSPQIDCGVARCTPPPSPRLSPHIPKPGITTSQIDKPSQHPSPSQVPPTPQSPPSQSPEAQAESESFLKAATPEAPIVIPLPMPKSSMPPVDEPRQAVIANLGISDDPSDSEPESMDIDVPAAPSSAAPDDPSSPSGRSDLYSLFSEIEDGRDSSVADPVEPPSNDIPATADRPTPEFSSLPQESGSELVSTSPVPSLAPIESGTSAAPTLVIEDIQIAITDEGTSAGQTHSPPASSLVDGQTIPVAIPVPEAVEQPPTPTSPVPGLEPTELAASSGMEAAFGKSPVLTPTEADNDAFNPPPEQVTVAMDITSSADNGGSLPLEDVTSPASPSSLPTEQVSEAEDIVTFTKGFIPGPEDFSALAKEAAADHDLSAGELAGKAIAHDTSSLRPEPKQVTADDASSCPAPEITANIDCITSVEDVAVTEVHSPPFASVAPVEEALTSIPPAQATVAEPVVEVAAGEDSNLSAEVAAAEDLTSTAETVTTFVNATVFPSTMASASVRDDDDMLPIEDMSSTTIGDSAEAPSIITPAPAAVERTAASHGAVWREEANDEDGHESDTFDHLSKTGVSFHCVSEPQPQPFHVESRGVRETREKFSALKGHERHPIRPGDAHVLQMFGGRYEIHTAQEVDTAQEADMAQEVDTAQEDDMAQEVDTVQEVDTERQEDPRLEQCVMVESSLVEEHGEQDELEERCMQVDKDQTVINHENDESHEDNVTLDKTCRDVVVVPTTSAVTNELIDTPPLDDTLPQDNTGMKDRCGLAETTLIEEQDTPVDEDDTVTCLVGNTSHEDAIDPAASPSPISAAVNTTQTVLFTAPPEVTHVAETADSVSQYSLPSLASGANAQEALVTTQAPCSASARSTSWQPSPTSPSIPRSVANVPATPSGPIRPNNIAALLNPGDHNVHVPRPETFSPPRSLTPYFDYARHSIYETRRHRVPAFYQPYGIPPSRSLINLPPRNSRAPFSAYHRSWEDTTSAIRATVSSLSPDSPERPWFGYPLPLSMGPTDYSPSHGAAMTSSPSAYAFSGLSDHGIPTLAGPPANQVGSAQAFGNDDEEEEVDALVDPEEAYTSEDSLPTPRPTLVGNWAVAAQKELVHTPAPERSEAASHELVLTPNNDDAVGSQSAVLSRKRRASPLSSGYTEANATASSKRARTAKATRPPAVKKTRTSPGQKARAPAAKKTRARNPRAEEPSAQAEGVAMDPTLVIPTQSQSPTPQPRMRTRRQGRAAAGSQSFLADTISAQGLSPIPAQGVEVDADVGSEYTPSISSRTRSGRQGRVPNPPEVDGPDEHVVIINQVSPSTLPQTRARRHVRSPSPQSGLTDAVPLVHVPSKRKRAVSTARHAEAASTTPTPSITVTQDVTHQAPAAAASNPATTKVAADGSSKKRSTNWTVEEIGVFNAYWAAYEANHPGVKGTSAAAAECADLMHKAGFTRTTKACLTRFQKYGAASK